MQTYQLSHILNDSHEFCSVSTHSSISLQMSHNFTISPSHPSMSHQILFHLIHRDFLSFFHLLRNYHQGKNKELIYQINVYYHFYFTTGFFQVILKIEY